MRSHKNKNGISVTAIPGTTGILLALNITKIRRKNFLGFSIYRETSFKGQRKQVWLKNLLQFPDPKIKTYEPIDSKYAPIQKFRWSDYAVYPNTSYTYTIYAYYSHKQQLVEGPTVSSKTIALDSGKHQVVFNRAVAASQAFERAFPNINPDVYDPNSFNDDNARRWLSRGLLEKMQSYILKAAAGHRLDVCIYEFELKSIVDTLIKAKKQGAQIRIVYHAKKNDEQTKLNAESVAKLALKEEQVTARVTDSIMHHKFIVLTKKDAAGNFIPGQVLTGSTNFTQNGIYRQANVLHIVDDAKLAETYETLFEELLSQKKFSRAKTIQFNNQITPVDQGKNMVPYFSPRAALSETGELIRLLKESKTGYIFCTAFDLYDDIDREIFKREKGKIKFGLQNTKSSIKGTSKDENPFISPAFLKQGLEKFLKESTHGQRGNILIHLKCFVIDFFSQFPVVITGSNNYSEASSKSNDENMLIVKADTDTADVYLNEMFRFYDHYRFRYSSAKNASAAKTAAGASKSSGLHLDITDNWTNRYFDPQSDYYTERIAFAKTWYPGKRN